jgi:hypothetical protein
VCFCFSHVLCSIAADRSCGVNGLDCCSPKSVNHCIWTTHPSTCCCEAAPAAGCWGLAVADVAAELLLTCTILQMLNALSVMLWLRGMVSSAVGTDGQVTCCMLGSRHLAMLQVASAQPSISHADCESKCQV